VAVRSVRGGFRRVENGRCGGIQFQDPGQFGKSMLAWKMLCYR
jgi:hypothetical protein